jgi:PAS domain S-box-containing protein
MAHLLPTRILLVDDNDVGRYALSRLLRREGFDVIEAATGHEALRLAAAAPQPDLIILDVKLPDMSGFTVCQALKQQPETAYIPVMQLSAVYVQEADKVQGLEGGADAYLTGPVEPPVLLATMRALLRVRQAEADLRASEERCRVVMESLPDAIYTVDAEGRITFCNSVLAQLTGYPPEALLGQPSLDLYVPEAVPLFLERRRQALLDEPVPAHLETELVCRDGRLIPVEVTVASLRRDNQVVGRAVVVRDISARQQEEAARRAQEQRLRLALEAAMAGSFDWDIVTGAFVWSPEYFTLLGLEPGSLMPTYQAWRDQVHPEDISQVEAALHHSLAERRDIDLEYRVVRPDGTICWINGRGHTFYNAAGEPVRMVGLMLDITNRKQTEAALREVNATLEQRVAERTAALQREVAERQQMQDALFQREKLAAMGSLLASVAHELNNPLSIILLHTDLLQADAGPGLLNEYAAEIAQAARRCERLVRQFLTLARQHAPERTVVDLNALVTETVEMLVPSLQVDTITVDLRLTAALPRLWADPHQLRQVLVNLVTNAQQALREVAAPRQLTLTTAVNEAQTRVTLEVADSGLGISPDVQTRIFEPFFTTKPPGVGTGLGLPLCRGILEDHGGTLECTSQIGRGTTFQVELPVGVIPETPLASNSGTALSPVPSSTILLVDDEPVIANAMARLLRRDGHTVDTAANGRLALVKLQECAYDLILSDLRMPELDGPGLYRALETRYPQLCRRFIFLTGDTLNPDTHALSVQRGVPQLFKPYTAVELRRIIHQVLQAG